MEVTGTGYLEPRMMTIIITRKCTIACPMCFFRCSPQRHEIISEELAIKAVEQIHKLDIDTVGITGGEPFLEFALMKTIVSKVSSYGITAIVVTNGHWATTEDVAFGKLSSLRDAGLTWIQISLDDQHQEIIPYDRVSNVVKAARALNFADIKIIGSSKGNSENFKYQLFYLQNVLGVDIDEIDLLDRPRVSHQHYTDSNQKRYPVADFVNEAEHLLPKPDCLNEMMIDVNGDVYPCCNNFVGRIGNISTNTLESTLKNARKNRYCKLIGNGGPLNLALHLDRAFKTNYGSQHYSTWCEVCAQMFQNETVRDLLLR